MPEITNPQKADDRGLLEALVGDGRFLLIITGLGLAMSGGFALFLSATGQFLPHDIAYLGMTAKELCNINECRIVHFMIHDRVSFGAVLVSIGALYMWLAEFPLKQREAWAWWTFVLSGGIGFASFLSYLGYGYLDYWHGTGTLLMLPCFLVGLIRSWPTLNNPKSVRVLSRSSLPFQWRAATSLGRLCLLFTTIGIIGAGVTIAIVGMTTVFVPQDTAYMGLTVEHLRSVNARLVPLIAHDRAGFGGGLCSGGIALLFCIWCAPLTRNLWQILASVGGVGFGGAISVHFMIGYTDFVHLLPSYAGAAIYGLGLVLIFRATTRKVI